ncbi:hypothetical protein AVEN_48036-1 [Araneus ventricosus]|uniref:Uncharacterized protein n=1 Tax=Araneus ventricosus TaxID=182803 RepID=A0A4Y2LY78_ARAVE|nr:hypothetical protein AVEN_48036-1 [Araneus ventricosus]
MDSGIQMKESSATGATGCKEPGKKKGKEREFSFERLHISPLVRSRRDDTRWHPLQDSAHTNGDIILDDLVQLHQLSAPRFLVGDTRGCGTLRKKSRAYFPRNARVLKLEESLLSAESDLSVQKHPTPEDKLWRHFGESWRQIG